MKKHGYWFFLLIFIGAIAFLWILKAPIMSAYLTKKMGVKVTMRTIVMRPSWTRISHFRIENPIGYRKRTALDVDETNIEYRWRNLFSNPSEIDLIELKSVYLYVNVRSPTGGTNNWSAIAAGIPKGKRSKRDVVVHKLIVRNLTVVTEGAGAKFLGVAGTKKFDKLEFDEISSKDGFPTKELIQKLFQGANIFNLLNPVKQIEKQLERRLNPFNLFGTNEKAPKKDSLEPCTIEVVEGD